jgi:putative hemolysin
MFFGAITRPPTLKKALMARKLVHLEIEDKNYKVKIARNFYEIDKALQLRFEVFNLEMGEGLESSYANKRDEDEFDKQCHHLIIVENDTNNVIGTYRLQTMTMARKGIGFYSDNEFNLKSLGDTILKNSVELGRACIKKEYRNSRVMFLLWRGIARYLDLSGRRYLFGCCSLNSQNPQEAFALYHHLKTNSYINENINLLPRNKYRLPELNRFKAGTGEVPMPSLMRLYLRYGAKVVGQPAIDREFKTIDYFILFDLKDLEKETWRLFVGK